MIKLNAIKWLIEHVTKWPTHEHGIVSAPDGWRWCKLMVGMELVKDEPSEMYADMHIIQQEWLNGTDVVEPTPEQVEKYKQQRAPDVPLASQCDAFDWIYDKYSKNLNDWPVVGMDCRTIPSPFGWSWFIPGKINQKHKPGTRAELVGPPTVDCESITYEQIEKYVEDEQRDVNQAKLRDMVGRHLVYYVAGPMSGYHNIIVTISIV